MKPNHPHQVLFYLWHASISIMMAQTVACFCENIRGEQKYLSVSHILLFLVPECICEGTAKRKAVCLHSEWCHICQAMSAMLRVLSCRQQKAQQNTTDINLTQCFKGLFMLVTLLSTFWDAKLYMLQKSNSNVSASPPDCFA